MSSKKKIIPVVDYSRCIACGMCWMVCSENAMKRSQTRFPEVDTACCTGCGKCSENCDLKAIEMIEIEA